MSLYLPPPCLLGSQSINKPLSSVLGHLLPAMIRIMKTYETKTQGDDHSLCRSGAKCWGLRFWPPRYFLQHWTCCDVSSLHEALQPTVHSESLVCNGCPFFFLFFLVFSYLSVCLGKEWRLREQEAISFVCNQEILLVPYGWGTSKYQIGHICLEK